MSNTALVTSPEVATRPRMKSDTGFEGLEMIVQKNTTAIADSITVLMNKMR